jgi:hypothetical protein
MSPVKISFDSGRAPGGSLVLDLTKAINSAAAAITLVTSHVILLSPT